MKKRLRKKRRLGEFAELGFRLRFAMSRNLDESARNTLLSWLEQHSNIENPSAGELVDAWHGWD